jgi:hypothetical protein
LVTIQQILVENSPSDTKGDLQGVTKHIKRPLRSYKKID